MEPFRKQEHHFTYIRTLLERGVYHADRTLSMQAYITKDPVPYESRERGDFTTLVPGMHWGDLFDCAWVHFTGNLPAAFPAEADACTERHWAVLIDLSAEGLVYDADGEPVQGLTSATSRNEFPLGLWGKRTVELKDCVRDGRIDFWADFTCCDVEGQYRNGGRVKEACTAWVDDLCRDAFYDWVVCQSLFVGLMENGDPYGETVGAILERAAKTFETAHGLTYSQADGAMNGGADFLKRDAYFSDPTPSAIEQAGERISILPDAETEPTRRTQLVLNQAALRTVRGILREILNQPNEHPAMTYSAMGHSHLDLLFLWTERETYRKCARTVANVLRIMDIDPTYKFTMSQAPVYTWLRERYPSLYARMLERIREGRFEIVGSLYIECDTNLPCGESLVRQLLYGKRYFRKEFGQDMRVCFLPDVFGYSAALPQLLKLADVPYFTTNKLSMNDTNRFPRYTFWWYGLDGTRVLTHMPPENSYTSAVVPQMAIYGEYHNTDKDLCPRGLQLFGLGDGGGGPGYEHIERRKRVRNLKGCPPFEDEFVVDFFDRISKGAERYREWHGELYFERHQGTYTSIAKQKQWNRTLEKDLHALEFCAALANGTDGYAYPSAWLQRAWEDVLLYQFHDCLPGSAIPEVYEQTQARYAQLHREAQALTRQALSALGTGCGTEGEPGTLTLNASPFMRVEPDGTLAPYAIVWRPKTARDEAERPLDAAVLENGSVRIAIEPDGTLSEVFDKSANRQLLKDGARGNMLKLYPDELTHWDINKAYLREPGRQAVCTGQRLYKKGRRQIAELTFAVGASSTVRQRIVLEADSACVRFETEVDWREEYQMLRVAFPTSVVTDRASCEIQFGHIERPTHHNTSWDEAKFEVCAHKWVDMADAAGGLALLSDCKYGYKIWDNTLDLCLLRSQNCPAQHGDRGTHTFTYAICPHTGDAWAGGVIAEGYRLNTPLIEIDATGAGGCALLQPFVVADGTAVLETVKKAEDSDDLLLRLYEARGGATVSHLKLDGYEAVELCNLLEEPIGEALRTDGDAVALPFHAFEIKTLRVRKKGMEQ